MQRLLIISFRLQLVDKLIKFIVIINIKNQSDAGAVGDLVELKGGSSTYLGIVNSISLSFFFILFG